MIWKKEELIVFRVRVKDDVKGFVILGGAGFVGKFFVSFFERRSYPQVWYVFFHFDG